jgi:hypothetical protein
VYREVRDAIDDILVVPFIVESRKNIVMCKISLP